MFNFHTVPPILKMCYAEKYIHTQQDYEGLWEEDGCYNTSLYQKTAGYHTYQQVGEDKNNKDDHELATCNPRYCSADVL